VSRHLMVHLKGKGNRHSWPDKVAVLHAWCRKGRSLGSCLSTGANDRPHCSIGREFTVNSPELLRSGRLGVLTPGLASGDTRCATTISRHRQQICTMRWRFTGSNTKRSGGGQQLSPANFVRTDPRSRYGRKSGFFP
jgi:hypothetical protein